MGFVGMTYLHLFGATAITALSANYPMIDKPVWLIVSALVSFILFFVVLYMAPGPLKYILFGLYVIFLGQSLSRIAKELRQKGLLEEVLASVLGIFLAMTAVGYYAGDRMLGFGIYLFAALVGLLLGRVGLFIAGLTDAVSSDTFKQANTWLSIIGSVLFSVFIAYDTSVLQMRAKVREKRPDYIDASLGLFLDIINLFASIEDLF